MTELDRLVKKLAIMKTKKLRSRVLDKPLPPRYYYWKSPTQYEKSNPR